ncbi:MAG: DUF4349 domain-containing protein [Clostridiales bacterium]|nr:DUF4349 domain-containing protein [Clostridiales bacterium]
MKDERHNDAVDKGDAEERSIQRTERIMDWLEGRMNPGDADLFQSDMAADASLAAECAALSLLMDAMPDLDREYEPSPVFHPALMERIRLEIQTEKERVENMDTMHMEAEAANTELAEPIRANEAHRVADISAANETVGANKVSKASVRTPLMRRLAALFPSRPVFIATACCCLILIGFAGSSLVNRVMWPGRAMNTASSASKPMYNTSGAGGSGAAMSGGSGGINGGSYGSSITAVPDSVSEAYFEKEMSIVEEAAYPASVAPPRAPSVIQDEVQAWEDVDQIWDSKDEYGIGSSLSLTGSILMKDDEDNAISADSGNRESTNAGSTLAAGVAASSPEPETQPSAPQDLSAQQSTAPASAPAAQQPPAQASAAQKPPVQKIIRTGYIGLEADSYDEAYAAIKALAGSLGGYVFYEETYIMGIYNGYERKGGSVQVKVPYDAFDELTEQLESLGKIHDSNIRAEDVTAQYIDIQARLGVYETKYQRLLALLTQSGELESILAVERELAYTSAELDSLKGQLRYLLDRTDYSTLNINLYEKSPEATEVRLTGFAGLAQRTREAFNLGVNSLIRTLGDAVVLLARNITGIAFLAILVFLLWILLIRKWLQRRRDARKGGDASAHANASPGAHANASPSAHAETSVGTLTEAGE